MVFPSARPGHSRRSVVNVDKFSGTKLSSTHPSQLSLPLPGICPSTSRNCPHLSESLRQSLRHFCVPYQAAAYSRIIFDILLGNSRFLNSVKFYTICPNTQLKAITSGKGGSPFRDGG